MSSSIITKLEALIKAEGFEHFGFSNFERPISLEVYENWLEQDRHGDMVYLKDHLKAKSQPSTWLPQARSAIVIGLNYLPHPEPQQLPIKHLKVARYAQGYDYHYFLKSQLNALITKLQHEFSEEFFSAHTDSSPVMERDLGYQAGLGWFGKNSCLIHPKKGSFFLIGEILTSLDFQTTAEPLPDFCGSCRRCIDQCPTGAIRDDRTLEATRCISYLNIETKGLHKPDELPLMGEWFFGCDICQEVCPWNQKVFGVDLHQKQPSRQQVIDDLRYILTSSNKTLEKNFKFTPLWRRRAFGLKRNALVMAYNLEAVELLPEINALIETSQSLSELGSYIVEQFSKKPDLS